MYQFDPALEGAGRPFAGVAGGAIAFHSGSTRLSAMRSMPAVVKCTWSNESELLSLYETSDFDTAVAALRSDAKLGVVTRSEKGCVVVAHDNVEAVPAAKVERVVDVTGAGDLFAAGFLVGHARGKDHATSARLGALAAAEVIQHVGARPLVSLKGLAEQSRLLV